MSARTRALPFFFVSLGLLLASVPEWGIAAERAKSTPVDSSLDLAGPVAILPFSWGDDVDSKHREKLPELPQLAREIFAHSFAPLPYEDMNLEQVDKALTEADLVTEERWRTVEVVDLASKLDAGTIVRGEVTKAALGEGGLLSKTALEMRIALLDGKTGSLLWQGTGGSSRRGGLLFRAGQATELFAELSSDQAQRLQALRATTQEAVRKLILTLPPPARIDVTKPSLTSSHAAVVEGPPREVIVEIQGTPDCAATFDIGSFKRFIPLWEVAPGVYRGGYLPQPGDSVKEAPVVFRLESRLGLAVQKISEEVRVTFP
jgi:hypothetical protein